MKFGFVEVFLAFLLASLNFFASWIFAASGIFISSIVFGTFCVLLYISWLFLIIFEGGGLFNELFFSAFKFFNEYGLDSSVLLSTISSWYTFLFNFAFARRRLAELFLILKTSSY